MITCEDFRDAVVSDDPARLAGAEAHAEICGACARIADGHREILSAAAAWGAGDPVPPEGLEARIAGAIAAASSRARAKSRFVPLRPLRLAAVGIPLAAALLLAAAGLVRWLPWWGVERTASADLADVYERIESAERQYVSAIAELDQRASAVLAHAEDPDLPPAQTARLLAYADELSHLDDVIQDVKRFLDANPGHSGGHTILLAAYREKADVLREVVELRVGENT